ncbi:MAG: hypothetical protein A2481_01630 [Candidatus Yonathbacteria bacterium RIFOXYC2_FULL_47_9]|nr:MAG: hypothetical protein A2481_01630 [Candidatus Yonathbacteria bacterium RIFOXYC2_FULL_47_9]HAT68419.1 hypothetical protein [Candidatus Yonathbacteria bacterium]
MGTVTLLKKPDFSLDAVIYEPTETAAWVQFVRIGESRAMCMLGEELESFLVFTLMRFTRRTDLFSIVLALKFLDASTEYTGRKKECALAEVGDVSLILAGLFPERSRKLGVPASYFPEMGRMAFSDLADFFGRSKLKSLEKLYRKAGNGFPSMMDVLLAAREKKLEQHIAEELLQKADSQYLARMIFPSQTS